MAEDRSFKVPMSSAQGFDAHYRRGAAIVALVFPLTFAILLVVGFAGNGLGSLPTHPLLGAALPTGLAAMYFWVERYTLSAVTALRNSGKPITVRGEEIRFFGRVFPLSEASSLLVQGKKISLLDKGRVIAVEPTFFVKSEAWDLNG